MKKIIALVDYKGHFGSKYHTVPYNSGMDKKLLAIHFAEFNINVEFISFSDVINYASDFWKDKFVIYTSQEDVGGFYKNFIEDLIYYLELSGAKIIPQYKYLKAHHNKVFMELLRHSFTDDSIKLIKSKVFGSIEELQINIQSLIYPVVYKSAEGAGSKGVGLAFNSDELLKKIGKLTANKQYYDQLWDSGRAVKYKGYTKQSTNRGKFIIQNFIKLNGDYKVLVFGNKFYVLKREVRKNDFRASGSGIKIFTKDIPNGMLEFANNCFKTLKVPIVSMDVAFDGNSFYLIEFQCLYFGSYTLCYSDFYWERTVENKFILRESKSLLEEEYARAISTYIS